MIDAAILCLAMNIYHEARGESIEGQVAVAAVTMNRVKSTKWPNDICEVVWQDNQFSWTHDGKSDRAHDKRALQRATDIAVAIYYTYNENFSWPFYDNVIQSLDGSTFYHADYVKPFWASDYKLVAEIGNHKFYK